MQDHGHIGGSMSIADVLSVIMNDFDIKKDEIIFSKGHQRPNRHGDRWVAPGLVGGGD